MLEWIFLTFLFFFLVRFFDNMLGSQEGEQGVLILFAILF